MFPLFSPGWGNKPQQKIAGEVCGVDRISCGLLAAIDGIYHLLAGRGPVLHGLRCLTYHLSRPAALLSAEQNRAIAMPYYAPMGRMPGCDLVFRFTRFYWNDRMAIGSGHVW